VVAKPSTKLPILSDSAPLPAPPGPVPRTERVARILGLLLFVALLPAVLYVPASRHVFWTVLIPFLPLVVVLFGFYFWRRVCPLALVGQAGQVLGAPGERKAGEWLSNYYAYVQLAGLVLALSLRLVGGDGTPWVVAVLLGGLTAAALATSFLYTGKTWCNFFCPMGIVERMYTEPDVRPGAQNSHCQTCTACKRYCPDIDLEHGYWKEADLDARRVVYFSWPGVVLGFYAYLYLSSGGVGGYLDGDVADAPLVEHLLSAGFFFAPTIPRVAAAPLTLLAFGLASYLAFALCEKIARARAIWVPREPQRTAARIRHRALAIAAFLAFLLFYLLALKPALAPLPWGILRACEAAAVLAAAWVLFQRWNRREEDYVHEKFARGILQRWEWGDKPPSENLADIYLIHTERTRQREVRLRAYKDTVRDLIADGVVSPAEQSLLDRLRVQLGVGDKEHDKILAELSTEEKKLFDPSYQGSVEAHLSEGQYRHDLERLVLHAAREGRPADVGALDTLRKEHRITDGEHARALAALRDPQGPIAAQASEAIDEIARTRRAQRRARTFGSKNEPPSSLAFFSYVSSWREAQHLERALSLLAALHPELAKTRALVATRDEGQRRQAIEDLAALEGIAPLGRLVALLRDPGASVEPPLDDEADAEATLAVARDASPYVRAAAVELLSRSGDDAALARVAEAVHDEEVLVRETAVRALEQRGRLTPDAVQRALEDPLLHRDPSSLSALEKMMLLHQVPLFASLEPDDLQVLSTITTEKYYAEGEELCRQGEASDDVFLVVHGQAQAWIRTLDGDKQVLGESSDGSCIGEMAALDHAPRSAMVTATAPTRVLLLPGKEFRQLLLDRPAISQAVLGVLVRRLRETITRAQKSGPHRTSA
jgi:CRP-like cAMP-binding protein